MDVKEILKDALREGMDACRRSGGIPLHHKPRQQWPISPSGEAPMKRLLALSLLLLCGCVHPPHRACENGGFYGA